MVPGSEPADGDRSLSSKSALLIDCESPLPIMSADRSNDARASLLLLVSQNQDHGLPIIPRGATDAIMGSALLLGDT